MLDNEPTGSTDAVQDAASDADRPTADSPAAPAASRTRRRATRSAGPPKPLEPATTGAAATEPPAHADPGTPSRGADTAAGPAEAAAPATKPRGRRATRPAAAPATSATDEAVAISASARGSGPDDAGRGDDAGEPAPRRTRTRKKAAAPAAEPAPAEPAPAEAAAGAEEAPAPRKRASRRRATAASEADTSAGPAATEKPAEPAGDSTAEPAAEQPAEPERPTTRRRRRVAAPVLFVAPDAAVPATTPTNAPEDQAEPAAETAEPAPERSRGRRKQQAEPAEQAEPEQAEPAAEADEDGLDDGDGKHRRRRGRRGRGRGKGAAEEAEAAETESGAADEAGESAEADAGEESAEGGRRRRRRRRRGAAGDTEPSPDDPPNTVVKVREPRRAVDEVQGVSGSTRLEAKRQRRRDGREQRRTRPPILSESEFLARREAVDRSMVVRQLGDRTQIAVLEDGVLVEHYVSQSTSNTMIGNVYLGKVQNVLPSMEAAFIDIGRGRNAVLYAGEVNWDSAGLEGRTRAIERALKPGDSVLVQVTKDPIGHKGARLTSHVTLSGRHLVYVPGGHASGISRKLPDTERKRLRDALKRLVPEHAGVIVRTAAEGASEDELSRDVTRLQALWETIEKKSTSASAPSLLYEEPDLVIRVVRDLFNEDFKELVVAGSDAWEMVHEYVEHVSPDLVERLSQHTGSKDVFTELRIDEQLLKALDRKVYLPSGGSLVIDRTEAMTVIDVNTGKFIGSGGNLEETVTRNNLEAAEEIVRQLRLRDVGGIIVIDFIDMVLESNRELVLRRLTECLGRDRTKHQVTEITSLGLVQMTRKRVGQPLIDAFSETCEHCKGRGVIIHLEPAKHAGKGGGSDSAKQQPADEGKRTGEGKRRRKDKSDKDKLESADKNKSDKVAEESVDQQAGADATAEQPVAADSGSGSAAVEAADGPAPDTGPAETPNRRKRAGTRRRKVAEAEPVTADS
ncbi:Rne/Rng family ribonuclease [Actinocatenispora sera]|uniref:Rne/Rng family ribonuclease n=1 Tax=Actinocatenispora sera TaxID=390989 RepID=UPI0033D80708